MYVRRACALAYTYLVVFASKEPKAAHSLLRATGSHVRYHYSYCAPMSLQNYFTRNSTHKSMCKGETNRFSMSKTREFIFLRKKISWKGEWNIFLVLGVIHELSWFGHETFARRLYTIQRVCIYHRAMNVLQKD